MLRDDGQSRWGDKLENKAFCLPDQGKNQNLIQNIFLLIQNMFLVIQKIFLGIQNIFLVIQGAMVARQVHGLTGCLECENPNPKLDSFLGRLTLWSGRFSSSSFLPLGCHSFCLGGNCTIDFTTK